MNKHPEITESTKQAFVDAFIKLNKIKPIEKISVRELTEAAGYNRSTFYNYFNDIYTLYEYFEDYVFSKMKEQIADNMQKAHNGIDIVESFTNLFFQWKDYLIVILGNPSNQRFLLRLKKQLISYWIKEFNLPENEIKINYQLDFYYSAILSIMGRWIVNQDDMTPQELGCLIQTIISKGVLSGIIPETDKK